MSIRNDIRKIARDASEASKKLSQISTTEKNGVLLQMADALLGNRDFLLAENAKDVAHAKKQEFPVPCWIVSLSNNRRLNRWPRD